MTLSTASAAHDVRDIPLADIYASEQQRKKFDAEGIETLAASIRAIGLAEPIVVRPSGDRYELVAGERRFRAFNLLVDSGVDGFDAIPAIVKTYDDQRRRAVQAAENLARRDLNPMEEADTYVELMADGMTIDEVAAAVGVGAHRVKCYLPLAKLIPEAQELVRNGQMSQGLGYALTGHPGTLDSNRQMLALRAVQAGDLTYADTLALVARLLDEQNQESMFDSDDFMRIEEYVDGARQARKPGAKTLAALVAELLDVIAVVDQHNLVDPALLARAAAAAECHGVAA